MTLRGSWGINEESAGKLANNKTESAMDNKSWNKENATYSFTDKHGGKWEAKPIGDYYHLFLNGELFKSGAEGWEQTEEGWTLDYCSFFVGHHLSQRRKRENTMHISFGRDGELVFS